MSFDKPIFLILILAIAPVLIFFKIWLKSLKNFLSLKKVKFRIFFYCLAWICLCVSFSRPSFGVEKIVRKKSGNAIAVVIDISQSMNAFDVKLNGEKLTRLEAAAIFTREFLENAKNCAVSLVLAKGDARTVVPLTEDFIAVENALSALSPQLIATAGTNLASGILEAASTFPDAMSANSGILFLTDGEELSGDLKDAVAQASKFGVKIAFVGFGSEDGISVVAGDGETRVNTALQSAKLKNLTEKNKVVFEKFDEKSCAENVFKFLIKNFSENSAVFTDFETSPAQRWQLFAILALAFLIIGKFGSQLNFSIFASCIFIVFSSCSANFSSQARMVSGVFNATRGNFAEASADFLQVKENTDDAELSVYSDYNLAASFLQANEIEAAKNRFLEIPDDVPPRILFAKSFNLGLICVQDGNCADAEKYFRAALKIQPQSQEAKINLELISRKNKESGENVPRQPQNAEAQSGASDLSDAIFKAFKEDEKNRWKNQQKDSEKSPADY